MNSSDAEENCCVERTFGPPIPRDFKHHHCKGEGTLFLRGRAKLFIDSYGAYHFLSKIVLIQVKTVVDILNLLCKDGSYKCFKITNIEKELL